MEEPQVRFEVGRSARYALAALLVAILLAIIFWRPETAQKPTVETDPLAAVNSVPAPKHPVSSTEIVVGSRPTNNQNPTLASKTPSSNELRLEAQGPPRSSHRETLTERLSGSSTQPEQKAPQTSSETRIHIVQSGDSPSLIARRYLGSPDSWNRIQSANPGLIPGRLPVGTRLIIPWPETNSPSSIPVAKSAPKKPEPLSQAMKMDRGRVHIVKPGETLSTIARHYLGDARLWKQIAKANPTLSPHRVAIGSRIFIPTPGSTAKSPTPPQKTKTVETVSASQASSTPPAPPKPRSGRTHVVQKGESLYTIAKKFYGSGNHWRRIRDANAFPEDSWAVHVGQKLMIP
ncbi:MAG: LysM peptidoglycan-binding domain-containing protein [Planctomycetota bacterium]|nr:LysM peptidoglycan-binding domain-containing protein [Planctomycetota bacterium]